MSANILMPALSPTMEKGNLAKWLKKEGDVIKSGDVLAEIETDKATMEVEAIDEGILAKIFVIEGTNDVPVNQLLAIIASEGEDPKAVGAAGGSSPVKAATAPVSSAAVPAAATPVAAANHSNDNAGSHNESARVFASPLARRIAKDAGVDLANVKGSGPHGRVVAADVELAKLNPVAKTAAPAPSKVATAPQGMSDETVKKMFEAGSFEEVLHDGMRKTIARRLSEAKSTIPHFYLSADINLDALMKLRGEVNKSAPQVDGKPVYKVSVNDFVIKALALALTRVPEANVSWTENSMLKHKHVDVGVAVSIPGGLITPIIRKAELKSISAISLEMKDMAGRAKARKLKPEEYQGGTTAVSNLGMFGVKDFAAIVNPPHASILAVGAGEPRAIVKDGVLAIATIMTVTVSTDHRAVDGALAAELMSAFKQLIENPMSMLV
jgi:pyruvate dehydrogenase E2 component (dihydrolipoamide acetyltransferase)